MAGNTLKSESAELVVLSVLAKRPAYGYSIARAIAARSEGVFRLGPGQLYPLLSKLEKSGMVSTTWEEVKAEGSDEDAPGRRRKWYEISAKGRKRLEMRIENHRRLTALVESFLAPGVREAEA